jgi:DNA-binding NarL/FixJ family response regulator
MLKILIVDDHPVVREGLGLMIERAEGLAVVGEAGDGQAAVAAYRELRPDVVLMDLRLPVMDGLAATRAILEEDPEAKVLMLTTFHEEGLARRALKAGAKGVLLKDADQVELIGAIQAAASGAVTIDPALTKGLFGAPEPVLSEREREILSLIARGYSNKEVAKALYLTENTVKTHLANLFQKLGVHDRAGAVAEGIRRGLLA